MRTARPLGLIALATCGFATNCSGTFSTEAGGPAADGGGAMSSTGGDGTAGPEAGTGGIMTGGAVGSGGASGALGMGGRVETGGAQATEAGIPKRIDIELSITNDTDDATWIGGNDERLSFSTDEPFDEVGVDADMGRAGFRFELPIPPNSVVESAVLRLIHSKGDANEAETTFVQVYDSASVPPFDENHVHAPSEHAPEGLWPVLVSGFAVGLAGSQVESPDLAVLVQHVVDRPDWVSGGNIAFVITPETLGTWVSFADSASGSGARLRVTYTPPFR